MVEQNARRALAIADRGYVLASGRNRFSGSGTGLLANQAMAEAFLGG
jgi:branched-chain amino acid transport system ATP-binding protein